ncbi:DUF2163 domain-containing protein [Rhodoplanes roseus]|uniref:Beta tubulin n=2 Tax=Rhodoplanes TaxID=29407 RepID=A0A327KXZ7_9BRAD|nr:DUF2163 domain-containing protein [Rhodoplanes roseus]RAI42613.1 beta tubulin [Rhodoplanes roseus]
MREIPAALQDKLDSGVTTLCRCWVLRRPDGVVLGFTDHDEDLVLDAMPCRAGSGLDASEATARFGLQVDGGEVSGALADEALSEADLAAGRYDGATVETWLVDWSEPGLRVLLAVATLGEVRREDCAFTAELRSLAEKLAQESGRLYTAACTADLGDARCGVDRSGAAFQASGSVATLAGTSTFRADGLGDFADGWFTAGRLAFTSGANTGLASEVKLHAVDAVGVGVTLWQAMPEPIAPGDAFVITAGCDKQFATCRDRFANAQNFRGFPHIPGNDYVIGHA